jgi:DNA polymerase III delta subunit
MLFVLVGKDREKVLRALHTHTHKKEVNVYEAEDMTETILQELIHTESLFGDAHTYVIKDVAENSDVESYFFDMVPELVASVHTFIVTTERLLKKQKEILETSKSVVEEYASSAAKKDTSTFALGDAFLGRDKKKAWLALHAELATKSPEEVHGGLWYNVKSLLLVHGGASPQESGLHPFVYGKIKQAVTRFDDVTLHILAEECVLMPHKAHRGEIDFEAALEQFILRFT